MTLPRRMLERGPRGEFWHEHNEDPLCPQRGCVPVAPPPVPPDARLRVAAQAVVEAWATEYAFHADDGCPVCDAVHALAAVLGASET